MRKLIYIRGVVPFELRLVFPGNRSMSCRKSNFLAVASVLAISLLYTPIAQAEIDRICENETISVGIFKQNPFGIVLGFYFGCCKYIIHKVCLLFSSCITFSSLSKFYTVVKY